MENISAMRKLLWVDAIAALLSGIGVFILLSFLSRFLNLPEYLLAIMSKVSILYSCFSFYLAIQRSNSKNILTFLVVGNSIYAFACIVIMLFFYNTANVLGVLYLMLESLFVAMLAFFEWRQIKLIKLMS
jgi:hypothetical protein